VEVELCGVERGVGPVEAEAAGAGPHHDPVGMVEAGVGADQVFEYVDHQRMVDQIPEHRVPAQHLAAG